MATEDSNSSNLKVPPLKIVLSSHQNNAVVSVSNLDEDRLKSNGKSDDSSGIDPVEHEDSGRKNSADDCHEKNHQKNPKAPSERSDYSGSGQPLNKSAEFSSSSSTSSCDQTAPTTPSPSSESLASNSTIISEHQQLKNKTDIKDDTSTNKQDKVSRCKVHSNELPTNSSTMQGNKRSQDGNAEQGNYSGTASLKEQILNANQRITRSSHRAAQQSKTDHPSDQNGDESIVIENLDKTYESARKAKRRKGELQEGESLEIEHDCVEATAQLPVIMANIYPTDYQPPTQNSFELYRDIRKRPYKKLMKLGHIQPRVPHGFKDYLINGGPYLLDGNKLGVGLNGARFECTNNSDQAENGSLSTNRLPLRMKVSNLYQRLSSHRPSQQRHTSYTIPKLSETPKSLQVDSPLHELFQDQEKARHQMRMQHLKERERSILAAEQEILRAYNQAAIADVRQKLHLSACTFFFYQERYHYLDEKSDSEEDLKVLNKEISLNLQEIDDKWDKIKKDMLVRHKNEADSLHAVQSLEWEWKAKEIGACDVRVSLKIEPEFVPRVEVAALDY